jgi:hypothetical protein
MVRSESIAREAQQATQSSFRLGQNLAESRRMMKAVASGDTQRMADYFRACFASGTPILGEFGSKPIEDYRIGDRVWARAEHDPACPVELKPIEEVFVRQSTVWHVHVGDHVIRTSDEHPFWVAGKGWIKANELRIGDILVGRTGKLTPVTDLLETGEIETVYNFRVADHHTYFVGGAEWGFDVWAHNTCVSAISRRGIEQPEKINGVRVLGRVQQTYSQQYVTADNPLGRTPHGEQTLANVQTVLARYPNAGPESYIVFNRSVRTAFGGPGAGEGKTFGVDSNLRMDAAVVVDIGGGRFQVVPVETGSPGQSREYLESQINRAMASLPAGLRNIVAVTDQPVITTIPRPRA